MIKKHLYLPICLLLVLANAAGCIVLNSRSVLELVAISGLDGERELGQSMRPLRGETRVLVFAIDGAGYGDFMDALRAGKMPRTSALVGTEIAPEEGMFRYAYSAPDVLSVLPSSTAAAWTSAFTGEPPGVTGVPGNEWFDRRDMSFHAPTPVSTDRRYQVLGAYTHDRLGDLIGVPTLYELVNVRSHVSLLHVYRGSDLLNVPRFKIFGTLFNAAARALFGGDAAARRFYKRLDDGSIRTIGRSLRQYGPPDLQVVYFPGFDLSMHVSSKSDEYPQEYLETVIDPAIGNILESYEARGILDRTYVLIVSDHGQTPVAREDRNALWREGRSEPPEVLRNAGFRVRPRALRPHGAHDYQAVMAMQGGMAFVYLADRSTCLAEGDRCDWRRPPRTEEDLMAAVQAFHEANRAGAHVPEMKGALDLILARADATPDRDGTSFRVFDGEQLVPIDTYLSRTPRPDLLELERRLEDLANGPAGYLAGDILLLSRMRLDEPVTDRTYFGEPYSTWHGSANENDSRILLVLAHRRFQGGMLRDIVRTNLSSRPSQMALTPLIRDLLDR